MNKQELQQLRNDGNSDVADYIDKLERAVSVLSDSYNSWPMYVTDSDELLINNLIEIIYKR